MDHVQQRIGTKEDTERTEVGERRRNLGIIMVSDCRISPTFSQTHVFKPGTEQADLHGVMALVDTTGPHRPAVYHLYG